jgi:cytochrome c oxidase subunit 2
MFFDFPRKYQISFQDPASPIMEGIINLHHDIFFYLLIIIALVSFILGRVLFRAIYLYNFPKSSYQLYFRHFHFFYSKITHGTLLEIIWTITPSIILMFIALPSFALLYALDEVIDPALTVKVIGNQWYWSYEITDPLFDEKFDSYLVPETELSLGSLRLLEVDNPLLLPTKTHIRFIVTSVDVLHSFTIPSLGFKVDAVPGRLNQISAFINRSSIFYGQCSELCGVNHGFMPITIKALPLSEFLDSFRK